MADDHPLFAKPTIDDELRELISNMTPAEWERWQLDHPQPKMTFSGWSDGGSTGTLDWHASSTQQGFISCRICDHTIILEPGEAMNFDHPDLCEHGRKPQPPENVEPWHGKSTTNGQ